MSNKSASWLNLHRVANRVIGPRWEETRAIDLTARELRLWIMSLVVKRKTIQLILTPFRNAVEQAVLDEIIESNPFDSIKLKKILAREQLSSNFNRDRNPYQTRHTYASSLLMLGANPLYVATQMGHVDTTMVTRTYGKWIDGGLDQGKRLAKPYLQTDPKRRNEFPQMA